MALARVHNDNVHPFSQEFKGNRINIPAGGFIEMEIEEAIEFKGEYFPMKKNKDGGQDPRSYKKIRVVNPGEYSVAPKFINPMTGKTYPNQKALDAGLKEHADLVVTDEAA